MKQEDWTQRLRDRLADYEEPVPEDLWAKIEARLPKEPAAMQPKARIIPLWARWAAAAAFVGAIVGTTALLWPSQAPETTTSAAIASSTTTKTDQTPMESERTNEPEPASPVLLKAQPPYVKPTYIAEAASPSQPQAEASQPETETLLPESETETAQTEQPTQSAMEPGITEESPKTERTQQDMIRELDEKIAEYKQHRSRRAAINLYASNGFGNLSSRNGVLMSPELLANYDYYTNPNSFGTRAGGPVYLANHEEQQTYNQPISFGLTVNFPISSGFSISSGVVYTRLRSDFTSISNSFVYKKQQTLHYVGIPLTVQYNVWQWHGLNVYATAGGQADFNVEAKQNTDGLETKLEKDDMQWSVNAAVGVQYNILPMLGIYAEPGIKYYFDNGSHIRNFFKHHPTNFNLQVGLRLNMGRP